MNYDVIVNAKQEKVGVGTFSRVSRGDFAQKFGLNIIDVYQGDFKRMGNVLRRAKPGKTYTYSSSSGYMDMMILIPLSDLGDEMSYLHTNENGETTFYPTDYHAEKEGIDLADCKEIPLSMAVQLAGIKSDTPMVRAIKRALLGGVR